VQLLALMKGEDIHYIRRLLERKIMDNPALRAKISPKTDVKLEDIRSRLQLYRKPDFSGLTRQDIFSVASRIAKTPQR